MMPVRAHAAIAKMMQVDDGLTQALRNRAPMPTPKLQPEQLESFFAAGYQQRQLLEIVLGVAQKVMSNYINHLADTPLDERFADFA